jgi:hypothetical protein
MNTAEELQVMLRIKNICQSIPDNVQSQEYNEIMLKIKFFLMKHCQHEIVYDSIDIDPDKSVDICYCVKCETTFGNPTFH